MGDEVRLARGALEIGPGAVSRIGDMAAVICASEVFAGPALRCLDESAESVARRAVCKRRRQVRINPRDGGRSVTVEIGLAGGRVAGIEHVEAENESEAVR